MDLHSVCVQKSTQLSSCSTLSQESVQRVKRHDNMHISAVGCKEKSKIQLYLLQLQWLHQHLQKKWAKKIQPTPIPSTSPNLIAVSLHRVVLRDLGTDTPHPRHGGLWLIFQTGCIYNQVISSAISMPCKSITLISVLCQFSFDWQLRS